MGLFKKRSTDPTEIERLRSEIASMATRIDAADQRLEATGSGQAELGERISALVTRLDTPLAPPPDEPPPAPVDPAEIAAISGRLDEIMSRIEGVDARVTAISTELARQIDELSGELDAAGGAPTPPTDEVVEELRDAQTRLANEQARYQIAFRQELADLADRLRRS